VKGHAHGEFFDGMALAFRDGKYGFVSQQGEIAVEPMFDLAGDYGEGLALVEINGAYGYIDKAGKLAIMPKFEDAGVFSDGLAQVRSNGRWGYIDTEGKVCNSARLSTRPRRFRDGLALTIAGRQLAIYRPVWGRGLAGGVRLAQLIIILDFRIQLIYHMLFQVFKPGCYILPF
jgi:hypothetical protein